MIGLGNKCPICGECGHTYVDDICKWCKAERPIETPDEPEDSDDAEGEDKCSFGQHDQLVKLGCVCPICGECGHTFIEGTCKWCFAEEKNESPETGCTFGQHDQMIELGCICPICKECGHTYEAGICKYCGEKSPFETAPDESGCTFGQHDQMIELGCVCPICGECGHTFIDGTCLWCFAEEENDSADNAPVHKCFAETEAVDNEDNKTHAIVCAECEKFWKDEAHKWEEGVCTECGAESPFSTAPEHKCFAETKAVDNKDGLTHAIKCAKCDAFWKDEAHKWEDGTCTECGDKIGFGPAPDEDGEENGKCTFGQHDQMIELGCICPICNECGHTYEMGICKYCGKKLPVVIAPICTHPAGVSVGQTVVEPTCEAAGYILTRKVCNTCGKTYEITSPLGDAIGHNWNQTIEEATCTTDRREVYVCQNCGDSYDRVFSGTATGHIYVNGNCSCGAKKYQDTTTSSHKSYTWDFQDVFFTQEP